MSGKRTLLSPRSRVLVSSFTHSGNVRHMWCNAETCDKAQLGCNDELQQQKIAADEDGETREEEESCKEDGSSVIDDDEQHDRNDEDWVILNSSSSFCGPWPASLVIQGPLHVDGDDEPAAQTVFFLIVDSSQCMRESQSVVNFKLTHHHEISLQWQLTSTVPACFAWHRWVLVLRHLEFLPSQWLWRVAKFMEVEPIDYTPICALRCTNCSLPCEQECRKRKNAVMNNFVSNYLTESVTSYLKFRTVWYSGMNENTLSFYLLYENNLPTQKTTFFFQYRVNLASKYNQFLHRYPVLKNAARSFHFAHTCTFVSSEFCLESYIESEVWSRAILVRNYPTYLLLSGKVIEDYIHKLNKLHHPNITNVTTGKISFLLYQTEQWI